MAELDGAVLDRMADVYQQALSRIQIAAEAAALSAWYALSPDPFDKAAMATWAATLWEISKPAADAAAALSHQYLSAVNAYVGIGAFLPSPNMDYFRGDFEGWVLSPFTVAQDIDVAAAGPHVSKLMSSATRAADQEAFDQIIDSVEWQTTREYVSSRPDDVLFATDPSQVKFLTAQANEDGYPTTDRSGQIKRWKRVPQAGACGWCVVLSDKILSDFGAKRKFGKGDGGKWHNYCRCTKRRLTPAEAKAFKPRYGETKWEGIIDQRSAVPPTQGNTP